MDGHCAKTDGTLGVRTEARPNWGPAPEAPAEVKQETKPKAQKPKPLKLEEDLEGRRTSRRIRKEASEYCSRCLTLTIEGDHTDCQPPEVDESDHDGENKPARQRAQSSRGPYDLEKKLSQLGLGGLVDFVEEQGAKGRAEFIVIGSTGNHYILLLSDERNTCQCVDFKTRGKFRPCKHLKLIYRSLSLPEDNGAGDWRAAVHRAIEAGSDALGEADEGDRERVEQRNQRREKAEQKARALEVKKEAADTEAKEEAQEGDAASEPPRKKKKVSKK